MADVQRATGNVPRLRPLLLPAGVALGLLLLHTLAGNRRAIARAESEAARLGSQRDSLLGVVDQREQQAAALAIQRETLEADVGRLRDSVIELERRRAAAQLTVRQIRTVGALQDRLRTTFPELGDSAWGTTTIALDARDTVGILYLVIPAWFAETFVIDHANAALWREEKDRLLTVDSLRVTVAVLEDSILALNKANADAYQAGYRVAYASYQDLSRRYVAELEKPRIKFGSTLRIVLAAGAGVVIGRAVR
jgi:hypothetical protein